MVSSSVSLGLTGLVVLSLLCLTDPAGAKPERSGLTGELSLGPAYTFYAQEWQRVSFTEGAGGSQSTVTERDSAFGWEALSVSLGGFINQDLSLSFRSAGTSYVDSGSVVSSTFYGPVVDYWFTDRLFAGGGPWFGLWSNSDPFSSSLDYDLAAGFALDARIGVLLVTGKRHGLVLALEVIPALYAETTSFGTGLTLGWKWY